MSGPAEPSEVGPGESVEGVAPRVRRLPLRGKRLLGHPAERLRCDTVMVLVPRSTLTAPRSAPGPPAPESRCAHDHVERSERMP